MGVYPDVNITSGGLHAACNLWVIQSHLSQNLLLATTVFWHPIVSGGVHIHGPIPGDLGVDHHFVRVSDATRARQLSKEAVNIKVVYGPQVLPTPVLASPFDLPPLADKYSLPLPVWFVLH